MHKTWKWTNVTQKPNFIKGYCTTSVPIIKLQIKDIRNHLQNCPKFRKTLSLCGRHNWMTPKTLICRESQPIKLGQIWVEKFLSRRPTHKNRCSKPKCTFNQNTTKTLLFVLFNVNSSYSFNVFPSKAFAMRLL